MLQAQQERVGRLIKYLQAMRGQQLWMYEEVNLTRTRIPSTMALQSLVTSLVNLLSTKDSVLRCCGFVCLEIFSNDQKAIKHNQ